MTGIYHLLLQYWPSTKTNSYKWDLPERTLLDYKLKTQRNVWVWYNSGRSWAWFENRCFGGSVDTTSLFYKNRQEGDNKMSKCQVTIFVSQLSKQRPYCIVCKARKASS